MLAIPRRHMRNHCWTGRLACEDPWDTASVLLSFPTSVDTDNSDDPISYPLCCLVWFILGFYTFPSLCLSLWILSVQKTYHVCDISFLILLRTFLQSLQELQPRGQRELQMDRASGGGLWFAQRHVFAATIWVAAERWKGFRMHPSKSWSFLWRGKACKQVMLWGGGNSSPWCGENWVSSHKAPLSTEASAHGKYRAFLWWYLQLCQSGVWIWVSASQSLCSPASPTPLQQYHPRVLHLQDNCSKLGTLWLPKALGGQLSRVSLFLLCHSCFPMTNACRCLNLQTQALCRQRVSLLAGSIYILLQCATLLPKASPS